MAHHHHIVQVLKTPYGYFRRVEENIPQFTDKIEEARRWKYWAFAFGGEVVKADKMRALGLSGNDILNSQFVTHKLYELKNDL